MEVLPIEGNAGIGVDGQFYPFQASYTQWEDSSRVQGTCVSKIGMIDMSVKTKRVKSDGCKSVSEIPVYRVENFHDHTARVSLDEITFCVSGRRMTLREFLTSMDTMTACGAGFTLETPNALVAGFNEALVTIGLIAMPSADVGWP